MQTEIDALTAQCKNCGGLKLTYYITWKWLRADAHSRTQSPSYARSTERDEGLWPNPYQTGL